MRWGAKTMLEIVPISLAEANQYVSEHHRHHKPVVGHKFSVGCTDGENIVGVAIVGRPVARYLDDGWTLEVNRLCTDGTRNACSMLYAAAWRAVRAMGYRKLITYILDTEPGTSLHCRGEGWAMKSVRPLAVPPVAYIENATADAVVDVIYPAMTYRKGYTEFKADNLPRQGRVEYISPRGWATLMLLSNADTRPLYRESFWILKK